MRYTRNFKKTVWGYSIVNAENEAEARKKFDSGETIWEHNNDSHCKYEEKITQED